MISLREMDKRNQLWSVMGYQVTVGFPLFFHVRNWCWEQWGPGIEHEHYLNHMFLSETLGEDALPWAWECSKFRGKALDRGKIYLRDDAQRMELQLRWMDG